MFDFLQKIKDAVDGKKTIITAIIGILTAALAWAAGELTDWQVITAIWVAVQIIFIRTGNKKDVEKRIDSVNVHAALSYYREGESDGGDVAYGQGYEDGYDNGYYEDEG